MFLTQDSGMIIGPISKIIGYLMNIVFLGLSSIGIHNVGLTIILLTLIVRIVMTPLTYQQQKFTKVNAVMQPEINKIQKKYRNKKDQASQMAMNEETQEVYAKYGVSPTSSCLQLVIQMPILLALYRVVVNIPAYITPIRNLYESMITSLQGVAGYTKILNDVVTSDGIKTAALVSGATTNNIIDFLYKFRTGTWDALVSALSANPAVADVVAKNSNTINSYNSFIFGINVSESPLSAGILSPYLLIPIAAGLFQFLSTKLSTVNNSGDDANPAAGMTKSMMYTMPLFSAVLCFQFPAGMGIYWAVGALFQMIQTLIVNRYIDRQGIDNIIEKNRIKAESKAASGKKTFMQKMSEKVAPEGQVNSQGAASQKTIGDIANMNTKKSSGKELELDPEAQDKLKEGSIASKANIMLKYKDK